MLSALELAPTAAAWNELDESTQVALAKRFRKAVREEGLKAFSSHWGAVRAEEEEAVRFAVHVQVRALRAALERNADAERKFAEALAKDPVGEQVIEIRGVGTFIGAGLAIASAQAAVEQGRDGIVVQLGAAPVTARSGKIGEKRPTVFTRRSAHRIMRKTTFQLGSRLMQRYQWASAQYATYRQRGLKAAEAFRRLVRSFSRVLNAILRDNVPFDEEKYISSLQAKKVPWDLAIPKAS